MQLIGHLSIPLYKRTKDLIVKNIIGHLFPMPNVGTQYNTDRLVSADMRHCVQQGSASSNKTHIFFKNCANAFKFFGRVFDDCSSSNS